LNAWTLNDFGSENLVRSDMPTTEPGPRLLDRHRIESAIDALYGLDEVKQAYADPDRGPLGKVVKVR
jgi:hypothetical protein